MNTSFRRILIVALFLGISLALGHANGNTHAQEANPAARITGYVYDAQSQPVQGVHIRVIAEEDENDPLTDALTQQDGSFALSLPQPLPDSFTLHVQRAHFEETFLKLTLDQTKRLHDGETITLPNLTLIRRISPAFWISTAIFVSVLVLIAAGKLHNTLSTLLGVALLFGISYLGEPLSEDLFIFDFHSSLRYVDWNVIFLILGMMMVIAVVERTGLFQWLALFAYRISRGRTWLLLAILMMFTGIASAFLDNVTTMLLMTPLPYRSR